MDQKKAESIIQAYQIYSESFTDEVLAEHLLRLYEDGLLNLPEGYDETLFVDPPRPYWPHPNVPPEVVYAVQYIEVEWGQRDEGMKLYLNRDECIRETKEKRKTGAYPSGGGYLGPIDPLFYYEVPFSCITKEEQADLIQTGKAWTANYWRPQFKSDPIYIK